MLGVQNGIQPSQTGGVRADRHKVFLGMLCLNCFPRTSPASEEQCWFDPTPVKYTGIVISTAEYYSFAVFISELEKVIAWFPVLLQHSCWNSFCGIDVGEGLWLGNCTALIFTEHCRTVGMSWLSQQQHGRMNPLQLPHWPSKSLFPWAQCMYWKSAKYCASWPLKAIFNLFCTSCTMRVCVYSTLHDIFISIFLFCNERPPAMSILKHAKGDSTLLVLRIHISRESMILIPVKFQLNKKWGRGWTFPGTALSTIIGSVSQTTRWSSRSSQVLGDPIINVTTFIGKENFMVAHYF